MIRRSKDGKAVSRFEAKNWVCQIKLQRSH